jgi:hypothetical protein
MRFLRQCFEGTVFKTSLIIRWDLEADRSQSKEDIGKNSSIVMLSFIGYRHSFEMIPNPLAEHRANNRLILAALSDPPIGFA